MKRILVAEDDLALASVVRFNLEEAGFEVDAARNGREAALLLDQKDFDLVVTDYQMPKMNGRELCLWMRQQAWCADTPVVLLTAKGLELDLARLREELRVVEVFSKPFSPRQLTRTIEDCLASGAAKP